MMTCACTECTPWASPLALQDAVDIHCGVGWRWLARGTCFTFTAHSLTRRGHTRTRTLWGSMEVISECGEVQPDCGWGAVPRCLIKLRLRLAPRSTPTPTAPRSGVARRVVCCCRLQPRSSRGARPASPAPGPGAVGPSLVPAAQRLRRVGTSLTFGR